MTGVIAPKRLLFAKFLEEEILSDWGRILFSLLNVFSTAGYQIRLFNNLEINNLGKYGCLILDFKNLTLTEKHPCNTENCTYIFDREDKAIGNLPWQRKISVRYDVFSSYRFKRPIIMPFPVHPSQNTPDLEDRLRNFQSRKKNMSIFFSGDTKDYLKLRIRFPKPKLARLPLVNCVLENMRNDVLLVSQQSVLESLRDAAHIKKCVIVDTNKVWVKDSDWLAYLAQANMFLSLPGVLMPMCHNAIEAMAVGTIPITNYPEWFDPNLTHMENCIAFDDENDLVDKLKLAMSMDENQLAKIRENVINYYETHLKAHAFIRRIETHTDREITLLILTGFNVKNNASKLNKNSILIRGTASPSKQNWLERITPGLFLRQNH